MPYAFVARVDLDPATPTEERDRLLREQVIPIAKKQPGFVRGMWMRSADGTTGIGIVVLDTEANAKQAAQDMASQRPPNAPPIRDSGVYEVAEEA
jgi:hypothetical protein